MNRVINLVRSLPERMLVSIAEDWKQSDPCWAAASY